MQGRLQKEAHRTGVLAEIGQRCWGWGQSSAPRAPLRFQGENGDVQGRVRLMACGLRQGPALVLYVWRAGHFPSPGCLEAPRAQGF